MSLALPHDGSSLDLMTIASWEGGYELVRPITRAGIHNALVEPKLGFDKIVKREKIGLERNGLMFFVIMRNDDILIPVWHVAMPYGLEGDPGPLWIVWVKGLLSGRSKHDRGVLMSAWKDVLGLPLDHLDSPFWDGEPDKNETYLKAAGSVFVNEVAEVYTLLGLPGPWLLELDELRQWLEATS